ncbi:MAG: MBL fold metallo-hydrolase [Burkholderiales bacterium]|jgi:glyoxylase-like metal-dependent hydrolase (beta-lactamase superfamily II)
MRHVLRYLLATLAAVHLVGAAAQPATPEVLTFRLSMSNVHAIKGSRTVLVDAGGKSDLPKLEADMAQAGIGWKDVAAVIVTHGHSDHAALAAEIRRRSGATLVLGSADLDMAGAGHNDDLKPTSFMATLLKQFAIDPTYEAFKPDRVITGEMRLEEWGIAGRVYPMPGHTPGSLVVELDDGRSFVGDMILGGWLGGAFLPQRPGEHYFHADRQRNLENIRALLRGPTRMFYLGHGGPVTRESVAAAFGDGASGAAPRAR